MISFRSQYKSHLIGSMAAVTVLTGGLLLGNAGWASASQIQTAQSSHATSKKPHSYSVFWNSNHPRMFQRGNFFLQTKDGATKFGLNSQGFLVLTHEGEPYWSSRMSKRHAPAKYVTLTRDGRIVLTKSDKYGHRTQVWASDTTLKPQPSKGVYTYALRISGTSAAATDKGPFTSKLVLGVAITRLSPAPRVAWIASYVRMVA